VTERFTLLTELGRGGMGVVWKARDEETGKIVAIKLLQASLSSDADYVTRFERELELVRRIHSPHVVELLGYGSRDGAPFLALEFVDGPSLREYLTNHGPYSWPEARDLLIQITQGLADAHAAGVIHRDLKPSNILINSAGVAKLADFGIAKGCDLTRVTGTSTLLGTPAYLPPEGPIDECSDLYSLGIIAYELLTGVAPFVGSTYQEVIIRHIREAPDLSKLPPEARAIVGWLLAKDPAARPQHAHSLLPVLYGVAAVPPPPVSTSTATPSPADTATVVAARSGPGTMSTRSAASGRTPLPAPPSSWVAPQTYAAPRSKTVPIIGGLLAIGLVVCVVALALSGAFGAGAGKTQEPGATSTGTGTSESVASGTPGAIAADTSRWESAGTMGQSHAGAHLLPVAGGALIVGNDDLLSSNPVGTTGSEIWSESSQKWTGTGSLNLPRGYFAAQPLQNGNIIAFGGMDSSYISYSSTKVYDASAGVWAWNGSGAVGDAKVLMGVARTNLASAVLKDGRVMAIGGEYRNPGDANNPDHGWATVEIFDPKTGQWSDTGSLHTPRRNAQAVTLTDGSVLVVGGDNMGTELADGEIWSPASGKWTAVGSLTQSRTGFTLVALPDGSALVAGGLNSSSGSEAVATAELLDRATNQWKPTASMHSAAANRIAVVLQNGKILFAGGLTGLHQSAIANAELYDPAGGTWTATKAMPMTLERAGAVLLGDGSVLVAGGDGGFPGSAAYLDPRLETVRYYPA